MKGADIPQEQPEVANLEASEVSTNQQALPVPLFSGEAKFALQWLCETWGQFAVEAPVERPGKK